MIKNTVDALEMTFKSVIVGALFGIIFGAANTYLGLRIGITISTSIPVAVLSVALFSLMSRFWGKPTILEVNMSQTIGSASSSLASGMIFTIPALFLWNVVPPYAQLSILAMLGGTLGVLAMIPLRRMLIAKDDPELPYPEGQACAEVLKTLQPGSSSTKSATKWIFWGIIIGIIAKFALTYFHLIPDSLTLYLPYIKKARFVLEVSPALIAVGYILGFRISAIIFAGSCVASLVLTPLIAHFGADLPAPMFPEQVKLISEMSAGQIWNRYIRYVGAGAVAIAGFITIIQTLPAMIESIKKISQGIKDKSNKMVHSIKRTERDLPAKVVIFGVLALIIIFAITPNLFAGNMNFSARFVCAMGVAIFGILFVSVSSRIVGIVGVSSNPTSAMTIVTLLGVSLVFALVGWVGLLAKAAVLTVGTVVCVAASIAGDTSQDLKTGYLLGATPARQQYGQLISVATACWAVTGTLFILGSTYGFGSEALPAPQAMLIKTIIDGVLSATLPWDLVFTGGSLGFVALLVGVPTLPFALGIYLPIAINSPLVVGGLVKKVLHQKGFVLDNDKAVLLASGLIAGEGLGGVFIAILATLKGAKPKADLIFAGEIGTTLSVVLVMWLVYLLVRAAKER
ncbi:oligopeptide transporter, OPT family [bacterium K02(2017)]|nr:oligopeptide transporter, OPT family [bacterium K02(2017)]